MASAEAFFQDRVFDLGALIGPSQVTFGYDLNAAGSGAFAFDFAIGGAAPEPSTWILTLAGFAALGAFGRRRAAQFRQPVHPGTRFRLSGISFRLL